MEIKNLGQVFTPDIIVDYMLNISLIDKIEKNNSLKILEPSAGDGSFLIEIIKKILLNKNIEKPINYIKKNIVCYEIDEKIINKLKLKILNIILKYSNSTKEAAQEISDSIIKKENFLFNKNNDKFDLIIGNPPYVRTHNIEKNNLLEYRKLFKSMKKGNVDLYFAFIEKGFEMLKENGELIFITPNTFFKSDSSKWLREEIILKNLEKIINFGFDEMIFDPKYTYTCIFKLKKNYEKKEFDVFEGKIRKNELKIKKTDHVFHNNKIILTKKINKSKQINNINFRHGLATLSDSTFVFEKTDLNKNKYIFLNNSENKNIKIEAEILKRVYRGSSKGIEDYKYIIFPYKIINKKIIPLKEEELETIYPETYKYLKSKKDILMSRSLENNKNWFLFGRSQGLNLINFEKLIIKLLVSKNKISFLKLPKNCLVYSGISCYGDLEEAERLLNDPNFIDFVYNLGQDRSGGYRTISLKDIKRYIE